MEFHFLDENRHHHTIDFSPEAKALLENIAMAISAAAQALVTQMDADASTLASKLANGSAQDTADVAAISTAYAPLSAAINGSPAASSALTVSPTTLPAPIPGSPYAETLTVSGGVEPYSITITGNPPPGLGATVSGNGILVDDPSPLGSSPSVAYAGNITITDSSTPPLSVSVPYAWDF